MVTRCTALLIILLLCIPSVICSASTYKDKVKGTYTPFTFNEAPSVPPGTEVDMFRSESACGSKCTLQYTGVAGTYEVKMVEETTPGTWATIDCNDGEWSASATPPLWRYSSNFPCAWVEDRRYRFYFRSGANIYGPFSPDVGSGYTNDFCD